MKAIIATIAIVSCLSLTGCGNLSPRDNFSPQLQQELDDIRGNQATLENNQNAIKVELGRLQNALNLHGDSNEVQQGWLNIQADGILIAVFSATVIGMLLFFAYRSRRYQKMAAILGEQVKMSNDSHLKERVIASAWNTPVEKDIFKLID